MNRNVILFCHVSHKCVCPHSADGLLHQYNFLCRFANQNNLSVEYCFLHEGTLDTNNPDDVLSSFLHCVQINAAELILVGKIEQNMIEQLNYFPPTQIYFVNDNILIHTIKRTRQIQPGWHFPARLFGYCRYACVSQFDCS